MNIATAITLAALAANTLPPECGSPDYIRESEPETALEVEAREFSMYLTEQRAVWSAEPGYYIKTACIVTTCQEEWFWMFEGDGALKMNDEADCHIDLLTLDYEETYKVYLPLVSN